MKHILLQNDTYCNVTKSLDFLRCSFVRYCPLPEVYLIYIIFENLFLLLSSGPDKSFFYCFDFILPLDSDWMLWTAISQTLDHQQLEVRKFPVFQTPTLFPFSDVGNKPQWWTTSNEPLCQGQRADFGNHVL